MQKIGVFEVTFLDFYRNFHTEVIKNCKNREQAIKKCRRKRGNEIIIMGIRAQ